MLRNIVNELMIASIDQIDHFVWRRGIRAACQQ